MLLLQTVLISTHLFPLALLTLIQPEGVDVDLLTLDSSTNDLALKATKGKNRKFYCASATVSVQTEFQSSVPPEAPRYLWGSIIPTTYRAWEPSIGLNLEKKPQKSQKMGEELYRYFDETTTSSSERIHVYNQFKKVFNSLPALEQSLEDERSEVFRSVETLRQFLDFQMTTSQEISSLALSYLARDPSVSLSFQEFMSTADIPVNTKDDHAFLGALKSLMTYDRKSTALLVLVNF